MNGYRPSIGYNGKSVSAKWTYERYRCLYDDKMKQMAIHCRQCTMAMSQMAPIMHPITDGDTIGDQWRYSISNGKNGAIMIKWRQYNAIKYSYIINHGLREKQA